MGRPRVRDKILLAAKDLLQEQGSTGLTTRGIAVRAGVTEASVFNNFGGKAGLIRALLQEQLPEFSLLTQALARQPEKDLTHWITDVFLAARDYFQVVLSLAGPKLSRGPRGKNPANKESYPGHSALTERLIELQQQGLVREQTNASAVALLLLGAALHSALTAQTLGNEAPVGDDELLQGVTQVLRSML
jgi:AcrR family transcriptional regulator